MAEFSIIDEAEAPRPVSPAEAARDVALEYERLVVGLRRGQAGRLEPGPRETARAVRLRLLAAARRMGVLIDAWESDEGVVHFRLY